LIYHHKSEEVSDDIIDLLGCKLEDIIHASVKLVLVSKIFAAIIENSTTIRRGGRAFTSFDF
jgi:hypothetical protein